MNTTSWLHRITVELGAKRRRWLARSIALAGGMALLLPLAQPFLQPSSGAPVAQAADLGWSDARPPLTEISDTTAPFRPLPHFGDVGHPLATASNGHLFTAGGSAGPSTIFKSVDGALSWRSASTPCSDIRGIRVSPRYADADAPDNTVVLLCDTILAISRNGGLSWSAGPTTSSGTELNVSFALSPDFNGAKSGTVLVGTTGGAESHTKSVAWNGVAGAFGPVLAMAEGPGSAQDSALAVAFPPGFVGAALPAGTVSGSGGAATWGQALNISNTPSQDSDQPEVAVGPDGTIHAVWRECCPNSREIFYASKEPGGAWTAPVNVSNSSSSDNRPAIAVDPDGGVHVVWERCCTSLAYATKLKGGSWSTPSTVPTFSSSIIQPGIAADANGGLHAVWADGNFCGYDIGYATKAPGGSWVLVTSISDGCNSARQPVVAADGVSVHVAWESCCPFSDWDIFYASKPLSGGTFSSTVNVSNAGGRSQIPSIAAGGGGAHLVWQDNVFGNDEVLYATKGATGGFSPPRNISGTSGTSEVSSVAVAADGAVHVLWTDCCFVGGNWDVLYATRTPQGIWSAPENISKNSGSSRHPRIAFGGGVLGGVWWDDTPGNSEILATSANVGGLTSISLDPRTGKAGDTVTVTGRAFRASASAAITFDGASVTTSPATITVSAAPTTLVKVSGDNQSGAAGAALASPFVLELRDNLGAPIAGASVSLAITVTPPGAAGQDIDQSTTGAQTGIVLTTGATGQVSTTLTLGDKVGDYKALASSAGVSDVILTATANPGPAASLASISGVGQNFQTEKVGTVLPEPFTATLRDALGNGVPGKTVTFTIATTPTGAAGQDLDQKVTGTQTSVTATTDAEGNAAATFKLGDTLGHYTVNATADPGLSVTFNATATSLEPTQVVIISGNSQSGAVLANLTNPFVVEVRDVANLPVNGALVRFRISGAPADATGQDVDQPTTGAQTGLSVFTGADGRASTTLTLGNKSGAYTVRARVAVGVTADLTATATPTAATALAVVMGEGQTGLLSAPLSKPFTVAARDAQGNGVSGISVAFAIGTPPTGSAGQQLIGPGLAAGAQTATVTTNSVGEASVTLMVGNVAGSYTVTATVTTPSLPVATFTATATDKITLPTGPTVTLLPPPGGFTATFAVPSAGPGTHLVEAIGKKTAGGADSSDKGAALFGIGNLLRIYWNAGTRIEEQQVPLMGTWPAPGGTGTLAVAATPKQGPQAGDRASIRLPSAAASLDNYWLGLNLSGKDAPADVYRRVGGTTPSIVDTNVGGAGTATRISSLATSGDFTTGTVFAGAPAPAPRVYKSGDAAQTWGSPVGLSQGRGDIGPGGVGLAFHQKSATAVELFVTTAGTKGGVHKSAAADLAGLGASFSDTGLTNGRYVLINDVQAFLDGVAFAVGVNTNGPSTDTAIFRTTNFGAATHTTAQWTRVDRRDNVSFVSSASQPIPFPATAVLYAGRFGVTSGQLLRSVDGGLTFAPTATDPGAVAMNTVSVVSDSQVMVGSAAGKVWRTADSGATWTASTASLGGPVLSLRSSSDFALGPPPAGALFASAQLGSGTNEAFVSTDGGDTFKQVGSSTGAWGLGGTSLSLVSAGTTATGYTLWARPRNAADNDIFRTAVDLTTPSASTWTALGAVPNVKGTGFLSMIISGVLASGVAGDGLVMYLIGRTPFGGPANVPLRTYFPKTVTEATWNRHFLPSMPVDSSSGVPGGSPPESTFPFSGNRDVIIDSFASSSTLGRLIVVRDFNSPTRLLTWTDTVAFLKAPVLSAPADGAIVERSKPLTLSWSALPQGVTYQFEVATDAAFNNRVGGGFGFGNASCPSFSGFATFDPLAPGTNTPFMTIPEFIRLQAGVQHFWRARVCGVEISSNFGPDQRYHPGPWSAARSFTVAPDPTIALTPTSGKPGDTVSFAIANMPPGEILKVTWDNPFTALVNVTSGTDGKATGSFVVPAGSPVGPHLVFAQTALLCCKSAAASFDLLSATAPGSATFTGQVQIGTAAAPTAPPSGYAVQVKIFPAGSTTAQASPAVQTDGTGTFSVTIVNLPAGAYDIAVKGHHTLTNKKANVTLPATGTTPVSFGVLLTGDLNSDDAIQGGDYSVLVTNFSKTGPQTVAGAATRLLAEAAGSVTLRLLPQFDRAEAGQVFSVGVVARTGDQPVDAVDLLLRFNAAILQLVDEEGNPVEMVAAGNALPVVLRNRADSEAGWVAFSAGRDPAAPAPAGDLAVATLRFRALVPISGAALPMALAGLEGSGAYYSGYQLLRPE